MEMILKKDKVLPSMQGQTHEAQRSENVSNIFKARVLYCNVEYTFKHWQNTINSGIWTFDY